MLQRKLHEEQLKRKDEVIPRVHIHTDVSTHIFLNYPISSQFLKQLMQQQDETDVMAQKLQEEADIKRARLIDHINQEEANVGNLVQCWLAAKRGPDPALLEKERQEREQLVSHLHLNNSDLRRQEIIMEMAQMLDSEEHFVQDYNRKREDTSKRVAEQETRTNVQLDEIFKNRGLENSNAIVNMLESEKMQKKAVEALIARNDSRTWGLVEQVRIIEAQLAQITHCEIARKKLTADESLVCEKNTIYIEEAYIFLSLFTSTGGYLRRTNKTHCHPIGFIGATSDSQRRGKYIHFDHLQCHHRLFKKLYLSSHAQLLSNIKCVELQREDQQQDFWLLQYQKLIDSQPKTLAYKTTNIDPLLGHQLLVSGVIHYIPLLATVFQQCNGDYADITDIDLTKAGVKNPVDRATILQAIQDYYQQQSKLAGDTGAVATAPAGEETSTATEEAAEAMEVQETIRDNENECVICMERAVSR